MKMRKEEKRRKFHEGLLNLLYPSPSSPHHHHQRDNSEEQDPENTNTECLDLDLVPDEYERGTSYTCSGSNQELESGHGCGPEKLSRAQRKRIRRKKLSESASRRQNIIGPLLPCARDDSVDEAPEIAGEHPPGVRQNAPTPESKQNKVKQRRMVKKLASESSKLPDKSIDAASPREPS